MANQKKYNKLYIYKLKNKNSFNFKIKIFLKMKIKMLGRKICTFSVNFQNISKISQFWKVSRIGKFWKYSGNLLNFLPLCIPNETSLWTGTHYPK